MARERNWVTFYGANLFVLILYSLMMILIGCAAALGILLAANGGNSLTGMGGALILILSVGEALVIGVPVAVFVAAGRPGKALLKLSRPRAPEMLLSFGMAVGGFGVFLFLQILTQQALSSLQLPVQGLDISISTGWELLAWIGALGVLPAVVEEFAFRGIVLGVYERRLRPFWAIALSAVLFGVLHLQVAFFYFYIGLGVILGFVVYRSRSIWPGILIHFTQNTLAVLLSYVQETYPDFLTRLGLTETTASLGTWGVVAAVSLLIFLACLFTFTRMTKGRVPVHEKPAPGPFTDWSPLLVIAIGLILLIGLSVAGALLLPTLQEMNLY